MSVRWALLVVGVGAVAAAGLSGRPLTWGAFAALLVVVSGLLAPGPLARRLRGLVLVVTVAFLTAAAATAVEQGLVPGV